MNKWIFFLPEWGNLVEKKLRLRTLQRKLDFNIFSEKARDKKKKVMYIKINGCANGIKSIINKEQI
jgi:hypothetical protein